MKLTPNTDTTNTDTRKTRNARTPRRRRMAAVGLAALVGIGTVAGTMPTASATTTAPPPRAVAPSGRPDQLGWDPASALANGIIAKIGGDALELALSHLGIKESTSAKFDKIMTELHALNDHMDAMETRMKAQLDYSFYSTRWQITSRDRSPILDGFQKLTDAGAQYQIVMARQGDYDRAKGTDKEAPALAALEQAQRDLSTLKQKFLDSVKNIDDHRENLHADLTGGSAGSIVQAYRSVLMNDRYLSSKHSQMLEDFYVTLENYEAVAAYLEAEANAATLSKDTAERLNKQLADRFDTAKKDQRAQLPEKIPAGVTIDVGMHATDTKNKTMVLSAPGKFTWFPGASTDGAPGEIKRLNDAKTAGHNDWKAPNNAEMTSLFAGADAYVAANPGKNKADYLTSIGLTGYANEDWIWTTESVDQTVTYWTSPRSHNTRNFQSHLAVFVRDAPARCVQPYMGNQPSGQMLDAMTRWVNEKFTTTQLRVMPTTNTGSTIYM